MSLAARSGLSGEFTSSVGAPFLQPIPVQEPSLINTIAAATIDRDPSSQAQPDDATKVQREIDATLTSTAGVWKAANDGSVGSKDAEMNGASKESAAQNLRTGLEAKVDGLQQKLANATAPEAPKGADGGGVGGPGRFAMSMAVGAVVTAINPIMGAAYGAAEMARAAADFSGKGTLVTFNQAPTSFNTISGGSKAERRAVAQEGSYARSESAPAAPAPAAPMMAMPMDGPGFGPRPKGLFERAEIARSSLTDPDFKGLKLDDTIAAKAIKGMENDAKGVRAELKGQDERGVEAADIDMARRFNQQSPALPSFRM